MLLLITTKADDKILKRAAEDLTLNIAVNLGRLSRWATEGKESRINQFLEETEQYLRQLESTPKSLRFQHTFSSFKQNFEKLKNNVKLSFTGQKRINNIMW